MFACCDRGRNALRPSSRPIQVQPFDWPAGPPWQSAPARCIGWGIILRFGAPHGTRPPDGTGQMITIFFRYDDYCALSSSVADRGLVDIFRRQRLSCTFAVVPAVTSLYPQVEGSSQQDIHLAGDKLAELRAAVGEGVVDLALHGWNHLANAHTGHPTPSEFKGLSFDEQVEILQRGRDFLEHATGVAPEVFVPPWNSYDPTTERALEAVGFRGISANRYSPAAARNCALAFAPMTVEIMGLQGAIDRALEEGAADAVIGVMMHPYDFHETGDARAVITLGDFENLLSKLKGRGDLQILPISKLLELGRMTAGRYRSNRPSGLERCYPAFVSTAGSDPIYRTEVGARARRWMRDGGFALLMLGIMAAGAAAGWIAAEVLSGIPRILMVISASAVLGLAVIISRALRAGEIYFRAAACIAFLSGVLLSAMFHGGGFLR